MLHDFVHRKFGFVNQYWKVDWHFSDNALTSYLSNTFSINNRKLKKNFRKKLLIFCFRFLYQSFISFTTIKFIISCSVKQGSTKNLIFQPRLTQRRIKHPILFTYNRNLLTAWRTSDENSWKPSLQPSPLSKWLTYYELYLLTASTD